MRLNPSTTLLPVELDPVRRDDPQLPHFGRCFGRADGELAAVPDAEGPADEHHLLPAAAVDAALRAFIGSPRFPCVGAKSAINRDAYRFGIYDDLRDADDVHRLAGHLAGFARDADRLRGDGGFSTFMAVFMRPAVSDEAAFERLLWAALSRLHQVDRHAPDPSVSSDPDDPHFSFSVGGRAFFVVGLHPGASRHARRFCWPTLVFNPHDQFERLREERKMETLQKAIRARDVKLQGTINPNLADFGEMTEARQYSGRPVGKDWTPPVVLDPNSKQGRCPFGFDK